MAGYSGGQKSKLIKRLFVLLMLLAAAVCIAALAGRQRMMADGREASEEKLTVYVMDDGEQTADAKDTENEAGENEAGENEDGEETEEISLSLIPLEELDLMGYEKLTDLSASSGLDQYTPQEYQAANVVDGDVNTCWMAYGPGVGNGVGEKFSISLGEQREVKYLLLNLGNWADFSGYKTITSLEITVGNACQTIRFPEEQTQFAVELSQACSASGINFRVWGISDGEGLKCSCVSEVEVYAKVKVQKGT